MTTVQRDRLAGIAEIMRQAGRLVNPPGWWLLVYAAEIEACIAEPVDVIETAKPSKKGGEL